MNSVALAFGDLVKETRGTTHFVVDPLLAQELDLDRLELLLDVLDRADESKSAHLGPQRGDVGYFTLSSGARIVLRICRRGGMVRFVLRRFYRTRPGHLVRPAAEYEVLRRLHQVGVRVPRPAAAWWRMHFCGLAYQAAFAMYAIENSGTLFALASSATNEMEHISEAARAAGQEARKMLAAGVFHVDLHPANVLVATDGVWLIDFDNAQVFSGNDSEMLRFYKDRLWSRWQRAVRKYSLSENIASEFYQGLYNAA